MNKEELIDPALSAVADIMKSLTAFQADLEREDILAMNIDRVKVSTPIELDVYHTGDGVVLGSAPPVYSIEVTDMPVFHKLTLTIARTKDDAS
ncbi:hypothetical protein AB9P05_18750 [Roseivirga sp. BDSF3-8]|uniref:hypothetical protein n=1 Tax=Roseivirga sp. BDSF3-8 TaxID=3241598 RepID=UPI0035322CA5